MALTQWENIKLSDMTDLEIWESFKTQYNVPDNCEVGDTVTLDGVECVCVATDITIQGSGLRRIAVDRNHDLGYYQKYIGVTQNGIATNQIKYWRWGGFGTKLGNTSTEVGYGLQNTINCLANPVNYTNGSSTYPEGDGYPWLWQGVNDFRASHSDKWFLPSVKELLNYVCANKSSLTFDTTTGGSSNYSFLSSTEYDSGRVYYVNFGSNTSNNGALKYVGIGAVRLCRAF